MCDICAKGSAILPYSEIRGTIRTSQGVEFPRWINVCGESFLLLKGVFPPDYFDSTGFFAESLPVLNDSRFLEVGAGCGAIAVLAAKWGSSLVVATDISRAAVANTRLNSKLHGVEDRVVACVADVADGISYKKSFDIVFWNFPWVLPEEEFKVQCMLDLSLFNIRYHGLEKFLVGLKERLAPRGRAFLGFGNSGDRTLLARLCREYGVEVEQKKSRQSKICGMYSYELLELFCQ